MVQHMQKKGGGASIAQACLSLLLFEYPDCHDRVLCSLLNFKETDDKLFLHKLHNSITLQSCVQTKINTEWLTLSLFKNSMYNIIFIVIILQMPTFKLLLPSDLLILFRGDSAFDFYISTSFLQTCFISRFQVLNEYI